MTNDEYFLHITSNGYWIFIGLEADSIKYFEIIISSLLIIPSLIILTTLCCHSSSCHQYGQAIKMNLIRISRDEINSPQSDLIREFTLQMQHEPFNISANGFFTLNLNLLTSMFATMLTYLVILIQFELSKKEYEGFSVTKEN